MELLASQVQICERFGAKVLPTAPEAIVGIAKALGPESSPVHGLRHPPVNGTSGWYLWVGELSSASDFFEPTHAEHLYGRHPAVLKYLGLPPGWRFLLAPGHEDV